MKAKPYLQQIAKIHDIVKNKMIEVEKWQDRAVGTTSRETGERVQTPKGKQKMADAVNQYTDIEEEIKILLQKEREIIKTIENLPINEYDVLHKIYVQGMTPKETSKSMKKSYSWVTQKHKNGLALVQQSLEISENEN